jgi:hypothetical protein
MDLSETETTYDVAELYLSTMNEAERLRQFVNLASDTSAVEDLEIVADSSVYQAMSGLLEPLGYPVEPPVYVRRVVPAGTLRRLGISGIYNPFTGEANIEPSSGALSGTFTMAHEMAHAMGVTREGEANFAAYLALRRSNEPLLRYSAAYFLWRYVASDVRDLLSEEDQVKLASAIPEELMIDRRAIWKRHARHEPVFPELSERLNDQYLKLQGVRAGTDDYNAFVGLYLSYRESIRE